jgi:cyanophycinase
MRYLLCSVVLLVSPFALWAQGGLFILGGGRIDETLMRELLRRAPQQEGAYVVILPMASEEPDSAVYFAKQRFRAADWPQAVGMFVQQTEGASRAQLDSLRKASVIYFSGGDQNRLMTISKQLGIIDAVHQAHKGGALIAGTSAGAAIMSKVMITGNQRQGAAYEETFSMLWADNIETAEGYGFLKAAVIDQHFVRRSRYNRLISLVIEHPHLLGIGIDESTAIYVHEGRAEVVGQSQVLLFRQRKARSKANNLLRSGRLELQILTAGDTFKVR